MIFREIIILKVKNQNSFRTHVIEIKVKIGMFLILSVIEPIIILAKYSTFVLCK